MRKKAEILIIDDLSTESNLAIETGLYWASKLSCNPTLINLERSDALISLDTKAEDEDLLSYIDEVRKKEKLLISKDRPRFFNENGIEPLFDFSDDIENIISKSVERKSKLIVVAFGKENSREDLFLGSSLSKLIRESKIPVLVVKDRAQLNTQKILLAFNINEVAMDAIEFASVICNFTDNSIVTPLHIINEVTYNSIKPRKLSQLATFTTDEVKRNLINKIDKRLKQLSVDGSFTTESLVSLKKMNIDDCLASTIKMSESDLVILGKNSDNSFFSAFKESEIENLLNSVDQSLLIVKPFK
jgi:nucleotide-binding universal stress UspA family protein